MSHFESETATPRLIGDGDIAKLVSLSKSWVRSQRFKRRHGLPHDFTLDPVIIGSTTPRYLLAEVLAWIDAQLALRRPGKKRDDR